MDLLLPCLCKVSLAHNDSLQNAKIYIYFLLLVAHLLSHIPSLINLMTLGCEFPICWEVADGHMILHR
jgi:hypothetical protein